MGMVWAIRTDSWHYRYAVWLRKYWGVRGNIDFHKACPYAQSTLWLTVALVISSPFVLLGKMGSVGGWASTRALDAIWRTDVHNWYNKPDQMPKEPSRLEAAFGMAYAAFENFDDADGIDRLVFGMFTIVGVAMLCVVFGSMAMGAFFVIEHGIPALIHLIPRIPHVIFQCICDICTGVVGLGDTIYWVAGMSAGKVETTSVIAATHIRSFAVWLVNDKSLWQKVAYYASLGGGGVAVSLLLGYTFYEIHQTDWMVARREESQKRKAIRSAAMRKLKDQTEQANKKRLVEWKTQQAFVKRQTEKNYKPFVWPKWVLWLRDCKRNLLSQTEFVGNVDYKFLGILPFISMMAKSAWKGVCPQVVFLSPEEIEVQKQKAQAAALQRLTDVQLRRAEWHARSELIRQKICERNGTTFDPIPFMHGTPADVVAQATANVAKDTDVEAILDRNARRLTSASRTSPAEYKQALDFLSVLAPGEYFQVLQPLYLNTSYWTAKLNISLLAWAVLACEYKTVDEWQKAQEARRTILGYCCAPTTPWSVMTPRMAKNYFWSYGVDLRQIKSAAIEEREGMLYAAVKDVCYNTSKISDYRDLDVACAAIRSEWKLPPTPPDPSPNDPKAEKPSDARVTVDCETAAPTGANASAPANTPWAFKNRDPTYDEALQIFEECEFNPHLLVQGSADQQKVRLREAVLSLSNRGYGVWQAAQQARRAILEYFHSKDTYAVMTPKMANDFFRALDCDYSSLSSQRSSVEAVLSLDQACNYAAKHPGVVRGDVAAARAAILEGWRKNTPLTQLPVIPAKWKYTHGVTEFSIQGFQDSIAYAISILASCVTEACKQSNGRYKDREWDYNARFASKDTRVTDLTQILRLCGDLHYTTWQKAQFARRAIMRTYGDPLQPFSVMTPEMAAQFFSVNAPNCLYLQYLTIENVPLFDKLRHINEAFESTNFGNGMGMPFRQDRVVAREVLKEFAQRTTSSPNAPKTSGTFFV